MHGLELREAVTYSYIRSFIFGISAFDKNQRLHFLRRKVYFRIFGGQLLAHFLHKFIILLFTVCTLCCARMTIWTTSPQDLETISVFNSLLIRNKNKFKVFSLAFSCIVIVQYTCALQLQKYSIQKMIGCDRTQQMIS